MNDDVENFDDEITKKNTKKKVQKKVVDIHSEEVIKEALRKIVKEKIHKKQVDDEVEAMVATCSEFLKTFIIMGYDFEGNAIKPVFYAKSDIDADALGQYLQKMFMSGNI